MDAREPKGEPIVTRPRFVRWLSTRPRIADVLVIGACTAPMVAVVILAAPPYSWLVLACTAGVAVALWWRRFHPLRVLLVVAALAALNPIAWSSGTVGPLEISCALYALAASTRLRITIVGYVVSEAMVFGLSGILILLEARDQWPIVLLQPAALVAIAVGVAVRAARSRRAAIEDLVAAREDRAAAAERSRITAEMHDVVAHSVTVMVALAGGASAGWEKHPERARHALEQLGTVGAQTLDEMQRILRVIRQADASGEHDPQASGHDLPSLERLIEVFRTAGLPVDLHGAGFAPRADPVLQTTVYRFIQESLTNVLRHAGGATYVEVELARHDGLLEVTVTDNGVGGAAPSRAGSGFGLRAMQERARAFQGAFEAGPISHSAATPGTGWRTRISLPQQEGGAA